MSEYQLIHIWNFGHYMPIANAITVKTKMPLAAVAASWQVVNNILHCLPAHLKCDFW